MENKMSIEDSFKKLYAYYGVENDNQLAIKLGYKSNSAISNWRKDKKIPDKYSFIISKDITTRDNNGYWISKITHPASAGTSSDIEGIEVKDEEDKIFLPTKFFKIFMKEENLRYIKVEGDSMAPKLKTGDWVIIDLSSEFTGDALYVINYQNILMVKALQIRPNGNLYIKSFNPDYDSYELNPDSQNYFKIIGKVIKTIS